MAARKQSSASSSRPCSISATPRSLERTPSAGRSSRARRKLVTASSGWPRAWQTRPSPAQSSASPGRFLEGLAVELLGLGQGAEALETGGESRNVGRRDHDGARRGPPEQSPDHGPAIRSSASWSARVVVVFAC